MKRLFAAILIICFCIIILPNPSNFEILGIPFTIPVMSIKTKILLIIGIFIFILLLFYLTFQEATERNIKNIYLKKFQNSLINYVQSRNGEKIDDLNKQFDQIQIQKDIYFKNNTLIIKTSNIINEGNNIFPGYTLPLRKVMFFLVCFFYGFKTAIDLKIIPYGGLFLGSLSILILLSYKLVTLIFS